MEAEDVAVFDGVGDGVGVQFFIEEVDRGLIGGLLFFDLLVIGVFLKNGGAGEAEKLGLGEKFFNRLVVVAELGAVAFVEDEHDTFVAQGLQQLLVGGLVVLFPLGVPLAGFVQRKAKLLNGGDDDLVGIVIRKKSSHEGGGVGVFLDAALLESVELLAGLAVEVFAIHDEQAFFDVGVVLEQGGRLKRGKRLAAAGGVPDIPVAAVLVDAVHDGFDGVDLIGPHHHQFLLAGDQDHVTADHLAQGTLDEERLGESIEVDDLFVVLGGELIDGEKTFILVKGEMAGVVVGEIPGVGAVADNKELDEAQQGFGVPVAGIVFVIDDLFHGPARADAKGLQLDLHARYAIDQDEHVVAVVAVVGVDAKLVDHLEVVFAPVADVDEGVVERRAVVAGEGVAIAQGARGGEDIRGNDLLEQALEFAIREADAVKGLELFPEIRLQRSAVANIGTVYVFETTELINKVRLNMFLPDNHTFGFQGLVVGKFGSSHVVTVK